MLSDLVPQALFYLKTATSPTPPELGLVWLPHNLQQSLDAVSNMDIDSRPGIVDMSQLYGLQTPQWHSMAMSMASWQSQAIATKQFPQAKFLNTNILVFLELTCGDSLTKTICCQPI
ncbi:uncharacterized protein MEPE_02596 [Melanopsichium pennsylvanicum]|uniref:Uncharacterized protein n=1 Tax=Melanopsichium pennsylvanicum TaxID=63383 RepID=A0AAJ4XMT6_9BASI|nr:uncharacterized protein MEPE_02596 [Melanopsichium pennsylvanicum]